MASTFFEKSMDQEMDEMEGDESNDSGDDASDDDMEENEEEVDPEIQEKISSCDEELVNNPYNYNAHCELVELLKKTTDFDRLRKAREVFSEMYPLTGKLWTDWIQDEEKIAATDEDKKYIVSLFEKGINDYLSVDLWLSYCQFALGWVATEQGIEDARYF